MIAAANSQTKGSPRYCFEGDVFCCAPGLRSAFDRTSEQDSDGVSDLRRYAGLRRPDEPDYKPLA